jgi:hypothetical protein
VLELKEDKASHSGEERSRNVRRRNLAFSENLWGAVARKFMESITNLKESHWASIYTHTADFMGRSDQNNEGHFPGDDSESEEAIRPQTRIQID